MTDEQWDTFALLLDKGFKWKAPFGLAHEEAYRTLLDGWNPDQIAEALRKLIARGQVFGPTPGEIVALIRQDPSVPTFDEAVELILHVLAARTTIRKASWEMGERDELNEQAMLARAQSVHPIVASFIGRQGLRRLRLMGLGDPDNEWREARRHELRNAWERHREAMDGRDIAALAVGERRGEIGRFDPLVALDARHELTQHHSQS